MSCVIWFFVVGLQTSVPGAERGSCVLQITINHRDERMRATQHAPRSPFRFLDRLIHRGALWASGAAQAALVVRIILSWFWGL